MLDPNKQDRDWEDVGDFEIKRLLACDQPCEQNLGIVLVDVTKMERVSGLVRIWSNTHGWSLSSTDIAEIWEATRNSIEKNVRKGRFEEAGSLNAYVRKIADRRAHDFLRRRIWIEHDLDVYDLHILRFDKSYRVTDPELIELIRKRLRTLSTREKLVVTHDLRLFYANNCKKWASPKDLKNSVNKDGKHSLTLDAVRSARARGWRKLRDDEAKKENLSD